MTNEPNMPTLIQQIERMYNQMHQHEAAPAELVGVSLTLLCKRGGHVYMTTMALSGEAPIEGGAA